MSTFKLSFFLLALCCLFPGSYAQSGKPVLKKGPNVTFKANAKALRGVYDGDTFNLAFRLAYIDTPEIKGKCLKEKELAIKARDFSESFMEDGMLINITVVDRGVWGRPIVEVRNTRGYLNDLLLKKGLAVKYDSRRKHDWCN